MSIDLMPGFGAFTQSSGDFESSGSAWNPSDKSSVYDLSNNNKRVTLNTSDSADNLVRSTTSYSTGKRHFGFKIGSTSGTQFGVGYVSAAYSVDGRYLGDGIRSLGFFQTGEVYAFAGLVGTVASYGVNDAIDFEVDFDNELVWIAVNGGNWNNNGSADPASGTGGLDVTGNFYATSPPFIGAMMNNGSAGTNITLRVLSGSFSKAISSGFSAWG